jgi:hypothetical protein
MYNDYTLIKIKLKKRCQLLEGWTIRYSEWILQRGEDREPRG